MARPLLKGGDARAIRRPEKTDPSAAMERKRWEYFSERQKANRKKEDGISGG